MKQIKAVSLFFALLLTLMLALAGPNPAAAEDDADAAAALESGTKIKAELESTVDARTAKPGDEVVARVTKDVKQKGKTVIRKGDRLKGRITDVQAPQVAGEASAEGKAESASRLSVVFDRLVQGESSTQLNTVLSAVLSTPAEERARQERMRRMQEEPRMQPAPRPAPAASGSSSASGGLVGGVASTAGSTVGAVGDVAGSAGSTVGSTVDSTVTGVGSTVDATTQTQIGATTAAAAATPMKAIRLDSEAQAENQNSLSSVLSTKEGNLMLESGTRLEFRVAAESQAQAKAGK